MFNRMKSAIKNDLNEAQSNSIRALIYGVLLVLSITWWIFFSETAGILKESIFLLVVAMVAVRYPRSIFNKVMQRFGFLSTLTLSFFMISISSYAEANLMKDTNIALIVLLDEVRSFGLAFLLISVSSKAMLLYYVMMHGVNAKNSFATRERKLVKSLLKALIWFCIITAIVTMPIFAIVFMPFILISLAVGLSSDTFGKVLDTMGQDNNKRSVTEENLVRRTMQSVDPAKAARGDNFF